MPEQGYKRCTRCGESKSLDNFHRLAKSKDGLRYHCKQCTYANGREWEQRNPERALENKRAWEKRNPDKVRASRKRRVGTPAYRRSQAAAHKRHAERHPEKVWAREAIAEAVRRRWIIKPQACEECGRTVSKTKLHGHHTDYSKPLDVEWLCRGCHEARHSPGTP